MLSFTLALFSILLIPLDIAWIRKGISINRGAGIHLNMIGLMQRGYRFLLGIVGLLFTAGYIPLYLMGKVQL